MFFADKETLVASVSGALLSAGIFIAVISLSRGCETPTVPDDVVLPPASVDAGAALAPVDRELEKRIAALEGRLGVVEAEVVKRRVALARTQRAEYDAVRDGGRGAVAEWLDEFNQGLAPDAGSSVSPSSPGR